MHICGHTSLWVTYWLQKGSEALLGAEWRADEDPSEVTVMFRYEDNRSGGELLQTPHQAAEARCRTLEAMELRNSTGFTGTEGTFQ